MPGRPTHPSISAETKKEFLVEGEWPYESQMQSLPSASMPIPPPPVEGVDTGKKDAYKMTSKPRGLGETLVSLCIAVIGGETVVSLVLRPYLVFHMQH